MFSPFLPFPFHSPIFFLYLLRKTLFHCAGVRGTVHGVAEAAGEALERARVGARKGEEMGRETVDRTLGVAEKGAREGEERGRQVAKETMEWAAGTTERVMQKGKEAAREGEERGRELAGMMFFFPCECMLSLREDMSSTFLRLVLLFCVCMNTFVHADNRTHSGCFLGKGRA